MLHIEEIALALDFLYNFWLEILESMKIVSLPNP